MSEENRKEEIFTYTYSARQQAEIRAIRQKYLPQEEDKMAQLRKMDAQATGRGTAAALGVGVISCLLLGVGMCCTMVWSDRWFAVGIAVGLAGIAGMAAAYPLYIRIVKHEREKIAPQIIRLTDDLLK